MSKTNLNIGDFCIVVESKNKYRIGKITGMMTETLYDSLINKGYPILYDNEIRNIKKVLNKIIYFVNDVWVTGSTIQEMVEDVCSRPLNNHDKIYSMDELELARKEITNDIKGSVRELDEFIGSFLKESDKGI